MNNDKDPKERLKAAEFLIREILPCCRIKDCEIPPTYVDTMSEYPKKSFWCDKHVKPNCNPLPYAAKINAWLRVGGKFF